MQIKVSVIIPVYNTYVYLKKCIDSILAQTLKEIEIIAINDGSTDNSLEILKEYKSNNQIILIDKRNEGQGIARNMALDLCRGKYIAFVDSDDYIENDMLQRMYEKAEKDKLDITICNYKFICEDGKEITNNVSYDNYEVIDSNECIKRFLTDNTIEGFSCNKLFSSGLFNENNIRYPENMKFEDIPTILNAISTSNRIGFVNKQLYYYVQRSESTTNELNIKNMRDFVMAIETVGAILKNNMMLESFKHEYQYYYVRKMMHQYILLNKLKESEELLKFHELKKYIRKKILGISDNFNKNSYFSKKELIKMILFRINLVRFINGF